jgi:Spy/CpxP family protein refolding chaperone
MRRLNMKMVSKQLLVAGALFLSATAALADGGGRRGHSCTMGAGFASHVSQKLGLSAQQQTQLTTLQSTFNAQAQGACTDIKAKESELKALWTAQTPDRNAILAKQAEIDPLRQTIRTARVNFRLGMQAMLTPEQRAQAQSMKHGRHHHANGGAANSDGNPG